MKQWHNSNSQPAGNRMNPWHSQPMPPLNQGAPPGFPCSCSPIRQNMNVYWQDQRRVSMQTHPGIQSHITHQQNIRMTMTHQPRQYQQPADYCQAAYQQGRNGNDCRNFHFQTHPLPHQYPMQPTFHQHQQQYPVPPPGMMMPPQQQYHQPPSNMYSLPIQPPSFHCQTGAFPRQQQMPPPMVTPHCYNTFPAVHNQRRAPQPSHVASTVEEQNFRHAVNSGRIIMKSPSSKLQNLKHSVVLKPSKGVGMASGGDLIERKELGVAKKLVKSEVKPGVLWSGVVEGTLKNESVKSCILCESDGKTEGDSAGCGKGNFQESSVAAESTDVTKQASMKFKVSEATNIVKERCEIGVQVGIKAESFFANDEDNKCDSIVFNLNRKENKMEKMVKMGVCETEDASFLKPSCQKNLGVIFECEGDKESEVFDTESETSSEKTATQLEKPKLISIFDKAPDELKVTEDVLNYERVKIASEKPRISRAVSREPRLKEIRNKWNITDKFGTRKSRASSRRCSQRRARSHDSDKIPPLILIASKSQTSEPKIEVAVDNETPTTPAVESRPSTERGYEYDINIDDMVNNICYSSTPSFTSSDDGQVFPEKVDNEGLECENYTLGCEHEGLESGQELLTTEAFEEDEYYTAIKGYSDDVGRAFPVVKESFGSSDESGTTEIERYDAGVRSIRKAFKRLSASITSIKERLELEASEPQKLVQETEESFLKFQQSYVHVKTGFQEELCKYPSDIHYDEIIHGSERCIFDRAVLENYEIFIDYKNFTKEKTKSRPKKKELSVTSTSFKEFNDMSGNYETNLGITYGYNTMLNNNYETYETKMQTVNNCTSQQESAPLLGVTTGTIDCENNNEKPLPIVELPFVTRNVQYNPREKCSCCPSTNKGSQDKLEDIDPNTINFDTSEMRDDTVSASSCESVTKFRIDAGKTQKFLADIITRTATYFPRTVVDENDSGSCDYLRPGVYREDDIPESFEKTKELAKYISEKCSRSGDTEKCAEKLKQSDRGSYLQPGVRHKSLIEIMKNSRGVDKNVPFSIKQLETSQFKNEEGELKTETSSIKCENWLVESEKPASEPKRIPSLFEVKVDGDLKHRAKADKRKQSTSSYGSGDAPHLVRRNESTSRSGSRPGNKKLTRRHKAAAKAQMRKKEDCSKEVPKDPVVSPGQKWRAIAPGMYKNVQEKGEDADLDTVKEVDEGMRIMNRFKKNPRSLSKILASARRSPK